MIPLVLCNYFADFIIIIFFFIVWTGWIFFFFTIFYTYLQYLQYILIQYFFLFFPLMYIPCQHPARCIKACVSPGVVLILQLFLPLENVIKSRISQVNLESKREKKRMFSVYLPSGTRWLCMLFFFFGERISLLFLSKYVWLASFCPSCSNAMLKPPGETVTPVLFVCVCLKLPQELDSVLRESDCRLSVWVCEHFHESLRWLLMIVAKNSHKTQGICYHLVDYYFWLLIISQTLSIKHCKIKEILI